VEINTLLASASNKSAAIPFSFLGPEPFVGFDFERTDFFPSRSRVYNTANSLESLSVTNMQPGEWAIIREGFVAMATVWGVMPQPQ
jgi:hypothetical protein